MSKGDDADLLAYAPGFHRDRFRGARTVAVG
jgi:hypothetical protein